MRLNRISKWLAAFLLAATPASAQITIPNTFTANTVARAALVNANFSQLGTQALNRAGGIVTGNISVDPGVTIDGIDISAFLGGTGTPTFASITVTGAATIGTTLGVTGVSTLTSLVVSSTGASAIDVAGGVNAGTGNVSIIGTDGRIPALTTTYFASMDGSTITGIAEANITDGTLLARNAANEVIAGNWRFTGFAQFGNAFTPGTGNGLSAYQAAAGFVPTNYYNSGAVADAKWSQLVINTDGGWVVRFVNDAASGTFDAVTIARTGITSAVITLNGQILATTSLGAGSPVYSFSGDNNTGLAYSSADAFDVMAGGVSVQHWTTTSSVVLLSPVLSGVTTPAALASGNTNDYTPASLASVYTLRITPNAANSTITGLAAQAGGSWRQVCNIGGSGTLTLTNEDALSGAANRFRGAITLQPAGGGGRTCVQIWYDTTAARWFVS